MNRKRPKGVRALRPRPHSRYLSTDNNLKGFSAIAPNFWQTAACTRREDHHIERALFNTSHEIDAAFESMRRERPDALFVGATAFLNARVVQLAQLVAFNRLPAIYGLREYAEAGGLMSYESNIADAFRQAGVYTGRILKGAKPADLPLVQASKFELVINARLPGCSASPCRTSCSRAPTR